MPCFFLLLRVQRAMRTAAAAAALHSASESQLHTGKKTQRLKVKTSWTSETPASAKWLPDLAVGGLIMSQLPFVFRGHVRHNQASVRDTNSAPSSPAMAAEYGCHPRSNTTPLIHYIWSSLCGVSLTYQFHHANRCCYYCWWGRKRVKN